MKNLILSFLLAGSFCPLAAQTDYAVSNIPTALLANANVVVRQYDLTLEVLNKGEAIETEHKVMTILNAKAEYLTDQYFYYDKIQVIDDIEGTIYDASGKQVRKIKKKDIFDGKADEHFVNDNRIKLIQFPRSAFPFTIEYTVVTRHKGLMFYPVFRPQTKAGESVQTANLNIIMPEGLDVRIKERNVPPGAKLSTTHWQFHDLPAIQGEPYTPDAFYPLPMVMLAPTKFRMEGYDGDMSSWESFGQFIGKLNEDKDKLPAETVEKLKQMTADCPDVACKIERVYAYLQTNTRYFFIGLGIGGWQPMPAKDVDEFKYSDCKGLSNYTVSMLRAVGIPAFYALIRAEASEKDSQYPDFPNPFFNHVIACAPIGKDTIWLECTSQTGSCGFMDDFTDDRPALLITPDGGKLVRTPKYDEKSNTIHRSTRLTLEPTGSALLQSQDVYRGLTASLQAQWAEMHEDTRKKELYEALSLSDFEIKTADIKLKKGRLPEANRTLELAVPKFASASGKRLFVPVVALAQKVQIPPMDSLRKYPVQASSRSFSTQDDLVIVVPEGYSLENGVEPIRYSSPFGTYELTITNEPGQLVVHRKLVLFDTVQPKEQYETLVNFFKNVAKADKTKLVLAKGT
jgi:hypothetical protein